MTADSAHQERVLVVYDAVHECVPEYVVLLGGRNTRQQLWWRVVAGVLHPERPKHVMLQKLIESLPGNSLYDLTEQNHVVIAVLSSRSRFPLHGKSVGQLHNAGTIAGLPPQHFFRVEPGAVSEQVADENFLVSGRAS